MLNKQYNSTHETAAKKIQKFYRTIKKYHKLKQACLANNSILTLRQQEIEEVFSHTEPSDVKTMSFLQAIRGIKMVASFSSTFVERNTKSQHPIPAINIAYTPTYMRDRDVQAKNFVEHRLIEQFKGKKVHIVFNNTYLIMILEKKLKLLEKSYSISDTTEEKKAIKKYLQYLRSMDSEISFIEGTEEISSYIEPILTLTGIKPSYYKIIEALNNLVEFKQTDYIMPLSFTKGLPLKDLLETADYIANNLKLKNHIVINIAINLVKGLAIFESTPELLDNRFNQQCFYMLYCCINLMYIYKNSNYLLNYLYDILIEEVAALLIHNGNPSQKTYSGILTEVYYSRIPIIQDKQWSLNNFLTSNGMQAISLAIINQEDYNPIQLSLEDGSYFEVEDLKKQLVANEYDDMINYVKFVTLEPSSYTFSIFSPEYFYTRIESDCQSNDFTGDKFITIIVDVSIESSINGQNKLQSFLKGLEEYITQGKVNIILVKSLQKYSLLGTAKYMAGNISIINNGNAKFNSVKERIQKYTTSIGLERNKEHPFLTFFLQNVWQLETLAANKAIENANFLKELFKGEIQKTKHLIKQLDNSPFIFFPPKDDLADKLKSREELVPSVDSFGFLHTTLLRVFNSIRLNPGLESKEYLTEILFNCSYNPKIIKTIIFGEVLLKKITDAFGNDPIPNIEEIIDIIKNNPEYKKDLLQYLINCFNMDNENYRNNKIYSLLYGKFSFLNYYFTKEFLTDIIPDILKTKMAGLTLEAKKNLHKLHIENCLLKISSLIEIDNYKSLEDLKNIIFNQDITDKFAALKKEAHKFFHKEDLFIFLINTLGPNDSKKNVIILNEMFKEHDLSLLMLFNVVKNFIKSYGITHCSLFLLYKLLEPSMYASSNIPLEYKASILNQIKGMVAKTASEKYFPEIIQINESIIKITQYTQEATNTLQLSSQDITSSSRKNPRKI